VIDFDAVAWVKIGDRLIWSADPDIGAWIGEPESPVGWDERDAKGV
jgi:hypothetical protein